MKYIIRSIIFVICSIFLTLFALLLAFISAGAGHGDYLFAKLLFPYTMLSTIAFDQITPPFILVGLLQIPIYAFILSLAQTEKSLKSVALLILGVHLLAVAICFVSISSNFS